MVLTPALTTAAFTVVVALALVVTVMAGVVTRMLLV
jgi:hypothetical protein